MALHISRIATVVSLTQLLEDAETAQPLTPGIQLAPEAAVASVAGTRLPRYTFAVKGHAGKVARVSSTDDFARVPDMLSDDNSSSSSDSAYGASALQVPERMCGHNSDDDACSSGSILELGVVPQKSLLDTVLLALWEECAEQGLFRYDVTACPTRVLPGIYGFVAQLNEGRGAKKRATEFRVDQVCQAFDPSKFNFKKAYVREVLFQFEPCARGTDSAFEESARAGRSPNLVVINVSPIEYGHVLLCPRVLDDLPQLVDPGTVLLALHFAAEAANPYFRVGYNSLGAYATINHLHFQAYYLAAPLPVERAPVVAMQGLKRRRDGVRISRLSDYPVLGFVVEGGSLAEVADVVGSACLAMQAANVPHNLLICDAGARVFVFPQCYAEKQARGEVAAELLDTGINPACWEIGGHMVIKRTEDYDAMSQDLAWRLLAEVSLTEEALMDVAFMCFGACNDYNAKAAAAEVAGPFGSPVKVAA